MNIDDYIRKMESDDTLQDAMKNALDDYHSHDDYIEITTWDAVAGYKVKPDGIDGTDDVDDIEQILSNGVVQKFIRDHKINIHSTKKTAKQIVYYVDCINSDQHTTSNNNHTDTFISVSLNGMINYHCNHAHCDGIHWKQYKKHYEDRDGKKSRKGSGAAPKQFDIQLVPGRELQKMDLPPIVYPVENMIPEGYTVASAPFKYGKSWLALEMCLAVAQGIDFLGQRTTKGSTVYMALEDCAKFAQERLNIALHGEEAPEGFYYIYKQVPNLDDGFIDYLDQLYEKVPNLKIIVIDVLALVEYQAKYGETAYKRDYRTGSALKQWADDHNTSVIAITHTTKMVHPNDIFMNTTGTSGVMGSADALLTIAKESRTDKNGLLAITGRRVRERYFKVHLENGYLWETDGEVNPETMERDNRQQEREERLEEYRSSDIRTAIIKLANVGVKKELSSRDVVEEARNQEVYLLSTPAEVGLFLTKYQNYFYAEDGIKVFIRKRGTGSNLYRLEVWEGAEDERTPDPWNDS